VIDAESFSYYTIVIQRGEEATPKTWIEDVDFFTISVPRPNNLTDLDGPE
jgi:hypothetical protein